MMRLLGVCLGDWPNYDICLLLYIKKDEVKNCIIIKYQ